MTEEKEILWPDEKKELKEWIPKVVEDFRKKGIRNIVALDKSGRPIGLLVWEAWKKMYPDERPKLFFINPSILQRGRNERRKETVTRRRLEKDLQHFVDKKLLEREHPHLARIVKEEPNSIGFVDEFSATGETKKGVLSFFKKINPKSRYAFRSFRSIGKDPALASWFNDESLTGVSDYYDSKRKKLVSSKAEGKEREDLIRFRKELKKLAEEIAENQKKRVRKPSFFRRQDLLKKRRRV